MQIKFQFFTDVEGDLSFFKKQIKNSEIVQFSDIDETTIEFKTDNPLEYFVFGGDACDRGDDISIVTMLVKFKKAYPDRVILIVGNRDVNKMRFTTELPSDPFATLPGPSTLQNTPIERLKWILEQTMNAPTAFECRRKELARLSNKSIVKDEEVYHSFRQSVESEGFMREYLSVSQIAAIIGDTLIVHGGVTRNNVGKVPNRLGGMFFQSSWSSFLNYSNTQEWIQKLNHWYAMAVAYWVKNPSSPYQPLRYIIAEPGSFFHGKTPVVGNFLKDRVTPWHVEKDVASYLQKDGINRILAGHQPSSGMPLALFGTLSTPLDGNSFQVFTCDTLYGHRDAHDVHKGAMICASNSRGTSFAMVHVVWNDETQLSALQIKGVDGYGVTYERMIHFPRKKHEDQYIGRILQIDNKYYVVRINFSGDNEKPYVLTHTRQNFSVEHLHVSAQYLFELESNGAFLTSSTHSRQGCARPFIRSHL